MRVLGMDAGGYSVQIISQGAPGNRGPIDEITGSSGLACDSRSDPPSDCHPEMSADRASARSARSFKVGERYNLP